MAQDHALSKLHKAGMRGAASRFRLPYSAARIAQSQALVAGVALVLLAIFGLFPLGLLLWRSVQRSGELTLRNYTAVFTNPANLGALWNTLVLCTLVMVACIILGAPLAWLVTRTDLPYRGLWRTLFGVPYIVPPLISAIAWLQLLNPRVGYLSYVLKGLLGLERGPVDINSLGGLVWVLTLYFYSIVFLHVAAALQRLDPSLEEAARIAGASPFRTMRDVALPLVMPSILVGALLVFMGVAASFSVVALIGTPARFFVLSTRIVGALQVGGADAFNEAMAMSGVLMGLALGALFLSRRLTRRGRFTTLTGKSAPPQLVPLGRWRLPMLVLLALLALVIVCLPLGAIVLTSFFRGWGLDLRPANLTLANYQYVLLQHHLTGLGLQNSLLLGAGSATLTIGVGAVLAYLRLRGARRLGEPIELLVTLPNATPWTVVALGMILAFSGDYGVNLYNTLAILLVAYVVKDLALGLRSATGTLQQVHVSLEEAALVSGAGWWRTFRDIVLPLVRPGLVTGWLLVFIAAFREVNMSMLLYGPRTATAGVALFELQNGGYYQSAAALAVVMLVVALAADAGIRRITRGALRA